MNGTVKVVLVCGFSLVFGFYAFMIQGMNNRIMQVGDQKSYYAEARMIATAGLNHAVTNMAIPFWWDSNKLNDTVKVNNVLAGGDTVSYVIEKNGLPSDQARVTVSAAYGGVQARQIVVIKMVPEPPYSPYWWSDYQRNKKDSFGNLYCKWNVVKVYVYPYQLPTSA